MHVFTDSKVALRDAVTRPSKRLWAVSSPFNPRLQKTGSDRCRDFGRIVSGYRSVKALQAHEGSILKEGPATVGTNHDQ
jgi:hypothetical protein